MKKINKKVYIYIPNIILNNLQRYIDNELENIINSNSNIEGILLGNIAYIEACKELKKKYNIKLVADYTLNINNIYSANFYLENLFDKICVSPELNLEEIMKIQSILPIEVVSDYVTVMTSRFCLIKAFSGGCNCRKGKYSLKDSYGNTYIILSDNNDCIMKIVRKIPYSIYKNPNTFRNSVI